MVTRVMNKNFVAIKIYMHSNKLKVNSNNTHLLVIPKSSGARYKGGRQRSGGRPSPSLWEASRSSRATARYCEVPQCTTLGPGTP